MLFFDRNLDKEMAFIPSPVAGRRLEAFDKTFLESGKSGMRKTKLPRWKNKFCAITGKLPGKLRGTTSFQSQPNVSSFQPAL